MNPHEETVLKEIQKRKALMLDPPKYGALQKVTGLQNESAISHILAKLEGQGLIERAGYGTGNIEITEKGMST